MKQDVFLAIQYQALLAAEDPDVEAIYRRICRAFSSTYNIPLPEVEDMDPIYVLSHFLESKYEELYNSTDEKLHLEYQKIKDQILYPEKVQKDKESLEDLIAALQKKNQENNKKNEEKQEDAKPKEGHNLLDIPQSLSLPDSGSFGEES